MSWHEHGASTGDHDKFSVTKNLNSHHHRHASMEWAVCVALACMFACGNGVPLQVRTPEEAALLVTTKLAEYPKTFFLWNYGGALVFDGIYQAAQEFPSVSKYIAFLDKFLDEWMSDPSSNGYKILHDIAIPFDNAIGDGVGLFPIAYLNRFNSGVNTTDKDLQIALTVADKYILGWPRHLPDGTISRNSSWPGQTGNNSFVWGDDQYMGLALLARLAVKLNRQDFADVVATQALLLGSHLIADDGVFIHGYNDADHELSCCKWGRANGWAMLSHIEALQSLQHFPQLRDKMNAVRNLLVRHTLALLDHQSRDGRWHQLINDTTTFLETSCTAMFLSAIARGHLYGWLDDSVVPAVHQAYAGLVTCITANGTVTGVCEGTGIQTSAEQYNTRSTDYLRSGPGGVGSVLYAIVDYNNFVQGMEHRPKME